MPLRLHNGKDSRFQLTSIRSIFDVVGAASCYTLPSLKTGFFWISSILYSLLVQLVMKASAKCRYRGIALTGIDYSHKVCFFFLKKKIESPIKTISERWTRLNSEILESYSSFPFWKSGGLSPKGCFLTISFEVFKKERSEYTTSLGYPTGISVSAWEIWMPICRVSRPGMLSSCVRLGRNEQ